MLEIELLSKLATIVNAPLLAIIGVIVWRFDRRIFRLELLLEKKEPSP